MTITARYLKVFVDDAYYNSGWYLASIAEFEVYSSGINVALNKTTTASGYYSSSLPSLAVNGTFPASTGNGNGWYSQHEQPNGTINQTSTNVWWQVDLGASYSISNIKVSTLASASGYAALKSYRIFYSSDGVNFTLFFTTNNRSDERRTDDISIINGLASLGIGNKLSSPEVGWKRYDSGLPIFKYTGDWTPQTITGTYNGSENLTTYNVAGANGAIASFIFRGTRLRLIASRWTSNSSSIDIVIDGVTVTNLSQNGTETRQILFFQIDFGSEGTRKIEIINRTQLYLGLDAVDIDTGGSIYHPDEVNSFSELIVGKRIRASYIASSGKVGVFANLGSDIFVDGINDFIPATSSATPNGSFYWIYVGNDYKGSKILVASRNIQHSISWDTLNQLGITSYTGLPLYDLTLPVVSAYDFNESFGTTLFSKTSPAFNGTITGTTITSGQNGSARSFNGTTDRITFTSSIIPIGSKTIRVKFRVSTIPSDWAYIFTNAVYNETGGRIFAAIVPSTDATNAGKILIGIDKGIGTGSPTLIVRGYSNSSVCDGSWHEATMIFDMNNRNLKVYIDGILNTTNNYESSQLDNTAYVRSLVVGANYQTTSTYIQFFTGALDSLEIYSNTIGLDYSLFNINANYKLTLRTLTGGVSASDTNDEWDDYIVNSTLNGLITAGSSSTWSWSIPSWTSTTSTTTNTSRVVRGGAAANTYAEIASSTATSSYGLRPVLIVEEVNKKYLFEDNNKLKKYDSILGWVEVGNTPVTESLMKQGMSDLSLITDTILRQLSSATPKVLLMGEFTTVNSKLTAVPNSKLIRMTTDIDLDRATSIDSFTLTSTLSGAGNVKIIVSATSGESWATFNGLSWVAINDTDLSIVKVNGITPTVLNAINPSQWYSLTSSQRKIRFAFYLEIENLTDSASLDKLLNQLDLQASWRIAKPGTDYDYEYPNNTTLRIKIFANGDYKINY